MSEPLSSPSPSSSSHPSTPRASSSKFLAYLEQRKSLTSSQAANIAHYIRQTSEPPLSHTAPCTSSSSPSSTSPALHPFVPSPSPSTRSISPPSSTSPLLSSSSSSSVPSSRTSPHSPSTSSSAFPHPPAPPLVIPSTPHSSSSSTLTHPSLFFPSPFSPAESEHKETILPRYRSLPHDTLPSPSSSHPSHPAPSPSPSPLPPTPSSLLQREVALLHGRLRSNDEERTCERVRLEAALQRVEGELAVARKEREAEVSGRVEWERDRERMEREGQEWRAERERLQREVERMSGYMSQVLSCSSPAEVATSALVVAAQVREAADNRRLKVKINRLIDEVNSKTMQLARQMKEVDSLRERLSEREQRLVEKEGALMELEAMRKDNVRMKAYETDWIKRDLEMKEVRRARAFYAVKEEEMTRVKREHKELVGKHEAVVKEVDERRGRMAVLEEENPRLHSELKAVREHALQRCEVWERRALAAEAKVDELESRVRYAEDKARSLQREVERLMKEKLGVDASALKKDLQWLEQSSERRLAEGQLASLQAEVTRLQAQLQDRAKEVENEAPLTGSGSARVSAELRRMREAGSGFLSSAVSALEAVIPASPRSSPTPSPPAAAFPSSAIPAGIGEPVKQRKKKRTTVASGEGGVSGPSPVPLPSNPPAPLPPRVSPARRASLPAPSPMPLVRAASASMPIKPALKGPLRAIHPLTQTSLPSSLSSTPTRSVSQSSLTSSGGSIHRVRFATPLSEDTVNGRSRRSPRAQLRGTAEKEQPDTPGTFRFKDAFAAIHIF